MSSIDNFDSISAHFLSIFVTGDYSSSAPEMAIILLFIQRRNLFKLKVNLKFFALDR